jgi:hypothetical protein
VHPPQLCRPAVGLVHHHEPVLRLVRLHVHLQVGLQGKGRIAQKAAVAVAIMVPTLVRRQALLLCVVIVANVTVELGRLPFAATTAAVAAAVAAPTRGSYQPFRALLSAWASLSSFSSESGT